MLREILHLLIKIAKIPLIISALLVLGLGMESFINWQYLTDFFSLLKYGLYFLDFIINAGTVITIIGIMASIQVIYWIWRASLLVIKWF